MVLEQKKNTHASAKNKGKHLVHVLDYCKNLIIAHNVITYHEV
jgi:hypothetical protein